MKLLQQWLSRVDLYIVPLRLEENVSSFFYLDWSLLLQSKSQIFIHEFLNESYWMAINLLPENSSNKNFHK